MDNDAVHDDTFEFYKEVNADPELGVEWDGGMLEDTDGDHPMNPIMDILQSLGVSAADAANQSVKFIKCSSVSACDFGRPCNPVLRTYDPSFFEVYGHGSLVRAAHGVRRNLNIKGLCAMDLRTEKPGGGHWDFSLAADRRLAKEMLERDKPTWVV